MAVADVPTPGIQVTTHLWHLWLGIAIDHAHAARLGHGGGGTTTLRVYAAWGNEADQRAADSIAARLPRRLSFPST
jgi:hypothetical protein